MDKKKHQSTRWRKSLSLDQFSELSGVPALRFPHEEPTPHVEALDQAGSMLYPPVSNVESWKIPELNEGLY